MNFTYRELFNAQNGCCFYCERKLRFQSHKKDVPDGFTKDHFLPFSEGYTLTNNVVLACALCNRSKSDKAPCADHIHKFLNLYASTFSAVFVIADKLRDWLDYEYVLNEIEYWCGDRTGIVR